MMGTLYCYSYQTIRKTYGLSEKIRSIYRLRERGRWENFVRLKYTKWAKTRALWRDSDGDVTTTNDAHTSDCCEKSVRTGWPALSGGPEHRRQRVGATHKFSNYQRRRDPRRSQSWEWEGWEVLRSDEGVFGESGVWGANRGLKRRTHHHTTRF